MDSSWRMLTICLTRAVLQEESGRAKEARQSGEGNIWVEEKISKALSGRPEMVKTVRRLEKFGERRVTVRSL